MKNYLGIISAGCWLLAGPASAVESFEAAAAGGIRELAGEFGRWSAKEGAAAIHGGRAKDGRQSLRLHGDGGRQLEMSLTRPLAKPSRLVFWAERWTARKPFAFRVDVDEGGGYQERWNGDERIAVGGFKTRVEVSLPAGTSAVRLRCEAPKDGGVLLDSFDVVEEKPMVLVGASAAMPVVPVLLGKEVNPVLGLKLQTDGALQALELEEVEVGGEGTTRPQDIESVELVPGAGDPHGDFGAVVARMESAGGVLHGRYQLAAGENWFWVSVKLKPDAGIDGRVNIQVRRVKVSGRSIEVKPVPGGVGQRIGVVVRRAGDDGSKAYRIPGLVRTKAGSLIAVYDIRYNGAADLPADIDVGVSRSVDGGRRWEAMRVGIDMGKGAGDGVGDPCVFVDSGTGRIWIAALWSHGNQAWHGSGPGLSPDETGQLVLVHSDDDGKTWSEPRNITREVKDPSWRLLLAGPGTGITMRDGTLVFPAQYRAGDGKPWSTLIWSKDHGKTWKIGSGVKSDTTEAQLVELGGGELMINCRDNRGGARTVATTRNLGKSWTAHPTDRKALPESVCMASLLAWDKPGGGRMLMFANPATTSGRQRMTVKVSEDDGNTWPPSRHTLFDERACFGYSCLAPADAERLGVFYEGHGDLYFLRLPVAELLRGGAGQAMNPGSAARRGAPVALVPLPRMVEWLPGGTPLHGWDVRAGGDPGRAKAVLARLPRGGMKLEVDVGAVAGGAEAYRLETGPGGVRLTAGGEPGLLRGLATLGQLAAGTMLPHVRIHDWPAFAVRGFMHDVGRNFQEVETIGRFVEAMAAVKMNVFHWHLTDGPGYRIESRRYPALNADAAYLPTRAPGKYYRFEQIRGLVRRAHACGVEVLPEIDMPGHSAYFDRAFGFGMQDPRGLAICRELLGEFCDEVVEPLRREGIRIPMLHLGSDEVHIRNPQFLPEMVKVLRGRGLEVVVWRPGGMPDNQCITQLWAKGRPLDGVRYIDSVVNYVNHMDFLDGPPHAFFHQPCGRPEGDAQALGAILCHWPDVNSGGEANVYAQSPVLPAMLAAAERFWRGLPEAQQDLLAELPLPEDPRLQEYAWFERDLIELGGRLAKDWPFPYHGQTAMRWRVLGPFPHGGDTALAFPPESMESFKPLDYEGVRYEPLAAVGGTIHLRHFFDFGGVLPGRPVEGTVYAEAKVWSDRAREVPCWIGFNTPSTSDRRAGPVIAGKWSNDGGRVWVNGREIPPPAWKNAGYMPVHTNSDERPYVDEGYAYREPTMVPMVKGWNRVLIKAPRTKASWKWMFTFLPTDGDGGGAGH